MSQDEANEIVRETQRLRRTRRALKLGLPTAAALGAGAAIAIGAIPGSDGVITGCYASPNPTTNSDGVPNDITVNGVTEPPGALRVIDPSLPHTISTPFTGKGSPNPAAVCEEEEKQITWNEKGPTGPPGPAGPQGPGGGQGTAGGQGAPGTPLIGSTEFGVGNGAGETFLKLDGIDGGATDKYHKGDISLDTFALSAQGAGQATGSGAGAGKVSIQSFTITKSIDKSSPLLLLGAGEGKTYKEAEVLFARKAGGKQQDYLEFKFSDVLISGITDGSSSQGGPTEEVTFRFLKCSETFLGTKGAGETVSFNVAANLKL